MPEVLYRDKQIVVCVKPAGVLSQDAGEHSMPQLLRTQLQTDYAAAVHRLDQAVGGVMVYALTEKAAAALSRSVQEKRLDKTYLAVLRGVPAERQAVLEDLLFHDQRRNKTYVVDRLRKGVKDARLAYTILDEQDGRSLVQVQLYTGRTHQIRVQFASRKLPLVGDGKYGGREPGVPLGLWSYRLSFPHPSSGKTMTFTKEPPAAEPWSRFLWEAQA